MDINIVDTGLKFAWELTKRTKTTHLIIHHTAAENQSVEEVHNYHMNTHDWAGIAYNFYIRKDGTIYKGRGWEYIGGHSMNYNSFSIGICFEGNYDSTSTYMPEAQYNAGAALIAEALRRYPTITAIYGHKTVNATACPGKYFPLDRMIADARAGALQVGASGAVTEAIGSLQSSGVISTPEYWLQNYAKLQYLGQLLINLAKLQYMSAPGTDVVTAEAAIAKLHEAGAMNSPEYWTANYGELLYLDKLLMNAANLIG